MKTKTAKLVKITLANIPSFENCHADGANIFKGKWLSANEVAILTAHQFNLEPSDPGTKHFLSLLVLRVCQIITK